MERNSTVYGRRPQDYPGYALAETLVERIAAGWRALARWFDAAEQVRRRAQARRDLHRLSDHSLKDIGLERGQIDSLFR
jgi:uncharacterized protein YjiS (DUF1127 family)